MKRSIIYVVIVYILISFVTLLASYTASASDTITTQSGLKYVRLKEGNGIHPKSGQTAKVIYSRKSSTGRVVESNEGHAPFKFVIDAKEVIPGWDEAVKLMSKGEKGILIVPPSLAYKDKGVKDPNNEGVYIIPPNATLHFVIELVDFK
ncbi:MAG: FKBP-type peptidyl-prolyl cis-trans isomerase [Cytophagales bacterium]|nr:FKBP-type peptidyl-prolyl cis-trans isomerase [Cytophaga sp.]